jgi:hypothetical protein
MKLTCVDYAGFDEVVTQLGAPAEVFYRGDASSTTTSYIVAYYSAAPYNVVVFESSGTVLISTVIADYATATRIPGLFNVEV